MSTSSLVFKVTSDVAGATSGFKKLAASLKPVKKESEEASKGLAKIGKTKVSPKVDTKTIGKLKTEIARLQDSMRKQLQLNVHADTRETQRKIKQLQASMKALQQAGQAGGGGGFLSSLKSGVAGLASGIAKAGSGLKAVASNIGVPLVGALGVMAAGAVTALGLIGAKAISLADQMEHAKLQMTGFTKNTQVTTKLLGQIQDFADKSPFEFPELVSASRRLLGVGVQAKKIPAQLAKIGDIAAQSGAQVDDLGLIFAQMTAAGRVSAEDMNQLADRGVNAWPTLAKAMGKSVAEVRKLGETGKLGAKEVALLWETLAEGSKGATTAIAGTLGGMLSTLKDTATGVLRDIGNALLPFGKAIVPGLTKGLEAFGAGLLTKLPKVVDVLAAALEGMTKLPGQILGGLAAVAQGFAGMVSGIQQSIASLMGALGDSLSNIPGMEAFASALQTGAIDLQIAAAATDKAGKTTFDNLITAAGKADAALDPVAAAIERARGEAKAGIQLSIETKELDGQISAAESKVNQIEKNIKNPKLKADLGYWKGQLKEAKGNLTDLEKQKATVQLRAVSTDLKAKIASANSDLAKLKGQKATPEIRAKIDDLKRKKAQALHDLAVVNVQKANPRLDANSKAFKSKVAEAERKLKETDRKQANPKIKATSNVDSVAAHTEERMNQIPDEEVIIRVKTETSATGRSPTNVPGTEAGRSVTGSSVQQSAQVAVHVNDQKLASLIDIRVNGRAARASRVIHRKDALAL